LTLYRNIREALNEIAALFERLDRVATDVTARFRRTQILWQQLNGRPPPRRVPQRRAPERWP
jgi:hypothetical protein